MHLTFFGPGKLSPVKQEKKSGIKTHFPKEKPPKKGENCCRHSGGYVVHFNVHLNSLLIPTYMRLTCWCTRRSLALSEGDRRRQQPRPAAPHPHTGRWRHGAGSGTWGSGWHARELCEGTRAPWTHHGGADRAGRCLLRHNVESLESAPKFFLNLKVYCILQLDASRFQSTEFCFLSPPISIA